MHKLLFALLSVCSIATANASIITDFAWVGGSETNSATTTLSDGTEVTLASSDVQFLADPGFDTVASIHDNGSADTQITLVFSNEIESLRLFVSDVDNGFEFLSNFSAAPSSVDSAFNILGTSVLPNGNNSSGNIYWTNLNATLISFTYAREVGLGISLDEMEFTTPVSTPATLSLLVLVTGVFLRRRRF